MCIRDRNIVGYRQPDVIGWICLQVAVFYRQYLVEALRHVKAYRPLVNVFAGAYFGVGHPAAVGAGKLKLVAVVLFAFRWQNRLEGREGYFPDPGQVVNYLLVFKPELLCVLYVLPFAAAAGPEVLTERLCPDRTIFMDVFDNGFAVLFFCIGNPDINQIAGRNGRAAKPAFHENNAFVGTDQTFAFCGHIVDADSFQPDGWFMGLMSHILL